MWRGFTSLSGLGKAAVAATTAVVVAGGGATAVRMLGQPGNGQVGCLPDMAYTTRTAQQESTALFWKLECGNKTVHVEAQAPLDVSLSPNGQQVAYSEDGDAFDIGLDPPSRQIFVADRAGASRQITHGGGDAANPVWSPDGMRLGFVRNGTFYLQDIAPDAQPLEITSFNGGGSAVWSADNDRVLLIESRDGGRSAIIEVNLADGRARRLDTLQAVITSASLSPDGLHLLFTANNAVGERALRQYALPTGSFTPIRLAGSNTLSPGAVTADWRVYYGVYEAEVLPGEPPSQTDIGIHTFDLRSGDDTNVVPDQSIQSLDVVVSGDAARPKPDALTQTSHYVALGDSFSSGEGAPAGDYIDGTDTKTNKCHRSLDAYPAILDRGQARLGPDFYFQACSGAIIQDFWKRFARNEHGDIPPGRNPDEPEQLHWLGPNTKTLTFTIGGNNANFVEVMTYCATRLSVHEKCEAIWGDAVTSALNNMVTKGAMDDDLPSLYAEVRRKAPNASVFVLGYPRFFPVVTSQFIGCPTGNPFGSTNFVHSDMQWMNERIAVFNNLARRLSEEAGLIFVDPYDTLDGHELCTNQPWLNDVVVFEKAESFHPNREGQAAMASITAEKMQQ